MSNFDYFIENDPITSAPRLMICNEYGIVTSRPYLHDVREQIHPHVKALANAYKEYCNGYGFKQKLKNMFNDLASFALDFIDMALGKERTTLPRSLNLKFLIASHQIAINQIFDDTLFSADTDTSISSLAHPQEEIVSLMHYLSFEKELDQMYNAADTGMNTMRSHLEFLAFGHQRAFKAVTLGRSG